MLAWDRGFQGESFLFASRWAGILVKGSAHKTELYSKWYQQSPLCVIYSRHIILCGYITKQSVETFLRDFLHKDRSNTSINAVIMGKWVLLWHCIKCNLKGHTLRNLGRNQVTSYAWCLAVKISNCFKKVSVVAKKRN